MTMTAALAWLAIGTGLVLIFALARWNLLWQHRGWIAEIVYALLIASGLFVLGGVLSQPSEQLALYGIAAAIVAFLAVRTQMSHLAEPQLRRSTLSASLISLLCLAGLFVLLTWLTADIYLTAATFGMLGGALYLACVFGLQTVWAIAHYAKRRAPAGRENNPPTVTLAIPARNETHALADCLEAALSSDYPRLEILVLDDCSQDKTSQLIKSFAHAGVRFVQGTAPARGWLGKNNAYRVLEQEATGECLMFIGVDTKLAPSTITELVAYMRRRKLRMVSVLPRSHQRYGLSLLLRNLRYVWQIILPRHGGHVPVSSECWLVRREALKRAGGFSAYRQNIVPEAGLAAYFGGQYRFLLAGSGLVMSFGKRWSSQTETAIRLWYPKVGQRPLRAMGLAAALLIFGAAPFAALLAPVMAIQLLALVICALYLATYAAVLRYLQPGFWWLSMWFLPLVLLQEAALVLISMAKYEFGHVDWKGRNICYPILARRE